MQGTLPTSAAAALGSSHQPIDPSSVASDWLSGVRVLRLSDRRWAVQPAVCTRDASWEQTRVGCTESLLYPILKLEFYEPVFTVHLSTTSASCHHSPASWFYLLIIINQYWISYKVYWNTQQIQFCGVTVVEGTKTVSLSSGEATFCLKENWIILDWTGLEV